jgi:serine/threonine-protein kinase HipA
VLTKNIDLDEGTCSLDLREQASEYLTLAQTRVTSRGRDCDFNMARDSQGRWCPSAEINRMASAFEHDDLARALAL